MNFFKKPEELPGDVIVKYEGFVQGPNGTSSLGTVKKSLGQASNLNIAKVMVLTNIKKRKLVNNINGDNMAVITGNISTTKSVKNDNGTITHYVLLTGVDESKIGGKRRRRTIKKTKKQTKKSRTYKK